MRKFLACGIAVIGMFLLCFSVVPPTLAAGGHYTPGIEGVMGPTVPPPGFHYRQYNAFVDSDTLTDENGDEINNGFELTVFAQVHRFIYITKKKFLGADYGMSLLVPIVGTDFNINAAGLHDSEIGLGDITFEPFILSWHKEKYDMAFALAINLPTGEFEQTEPASSGRGYTSGLMTFGGTYYLDAAKSWSVAALSRTLVYGEQEDTDYEPGWEFIVDWGIGKQIPVSKGLLVRPGICGYGYWQIGEDSGPTATDVKGTLYAVGGELNLFWLPPHLTQANLRILKDISSEDEVEATKVVFTLTKSF